VEVENRQVLERTLAELHESIATREQLSATVRELSSPVLPVLDGILVMPLIGVIDLARATVILNSLLQAIEQHRAHMVIMDVTGVPLLDTQGARVLLQAADAGKLLGAQLILVGLRPELAQTLIALGLSLSNLLTLADLQSGVIYAVQQLQRGRVRTTNGQYVQN
jgi:rsbT co-antagonist protein RsbR